MVPNVGGWCHNWEDAWSQSWENNSGKDWLTKEATVVI